IAPLHITDGKVRALLFDGNYFITPPNQSYIPHPPLGTTCRIFMWADGLYRDDDPMCWPQPYTSTHCHHACIPHPNSLASHAIIWWEPLMILNPETQTKPTKWLQMV
ncbi:hypothetical protein L208DRAFT_1318865, partial [Tricholoma matsutake]